MRNLSSEVGENSRWWTQLRMGGNVIINCEVLEHCDTVSLHMFAHRRACCPHWINNKSRVILSQQEGALLRNHDEQQACVKVTKKLISYHDRSEIRLISSVPWCIFQVSWLYIGIWKSGECVFNAAQGALWTKDISLNSMKIVKILLFPHRPFCFILIWASVPFLCWRGASRGHTQGGIPGKDFRAQQRRMCV